MANNNSNKILIIEDNPDLVEMYNLKFRNEGFEVFTAKDGEEGINKVVEKKPDIILLDLLMPNMNGFEVLKTIKDNTEMNVKIIVLSNLGQQSQIDKAYELGATYYMVKANFTPAEVVDKVKELAGEEDEKAFYIKGEAGKYDIDKVLSLLPADLKKECTKDGGEFVVKLTPKGKGKDNKWEATIQSSRT
jgi:DNA-binding response OmpR family regulator